MNPARIAIILVAGVAAICLALIVRNIAARPPQARAPVIAAQAPSQPMTRVLVAKADLSVGQALTQDNMAWQAWPAATVNAAYVTDGVVATAPPSAGAVGAINKAKTTVNDMATGGGPKMQAMMGAIVREAIYAGEPITSSKVVRSGDSSYMAVRLPEGMRAYSLPLTVETGAGGFIEPGDRIDILSTHADPSHTGGGSSLVTETVLSNVPVLAIDQHTDTPKAGQAQPGATITLEIPAYAVPNVARARTLGGLTMALRSYADIAGRARGPSANDGRTVRLFKGGGSAELVTTQ
ncbi:MAG TPA: Flp pilus assembly protein CpaB [Caulobacteraceae bacterium]|nr:Flp pilus assembly protein CpaB [Caulobacteraceae bacterium]